MIFFLLFRIKILFKIKFIKRETDNRNENSFSILKGLFFLNKFSVKPYF
jgi:hypothetical protein